MEQNYYILDGGIRCLGVKCKCRKIHKPPQVRAHLLQYGFMPNYDIWVNHGEDGSNVQNFGYVSCSYENMNCGHQFVSVTEMVYDAYMQTCNLMHVEVNTGNENLYEEPPNDEAQRFYEMLAGANEPIYEGAIKSRLTIAIRLLVARINWHVPKKCLDHFIQMLLDVAPKDKK